MSEDANHTTTALWCLIDGDSTPFGVTAPASASIDRLKEIIHEKRKLGAFRNVDYVDLAPCKLNAALPVRPSKTLSSRITSSKTGIQLQELVEPTDKVLDVFPHQPPESDLHLLVKLPAGSRFLRSYASKLSTPSPDEKLRQGNNHDGSRHIDSLAKGFEIVSFAATFIAAAQAQIIGNVNTGLGENTSLRAVDALFQSGLILDVMAASIAFLTTRWFQRLDNDEEAHLERQFEIQNAIKRGKMDQSPEGEKAKPLDRRRVGHTFLSLSLFVPMPLLVIGVVCMISGLVTAMWSQHPVVDAVLVTFSIEEKPSSLD